MIRYRILDACRTFAEKTTCMVIGHNWGEIGLFKSGWGCRRCWYECRSK